MKLHVPLPARVTAAPARLAAGVRPGHLGVLAALALSITAWIVSYRHHLVLAYNDSMSHLGIARGIFDNLQPGLAQVGTVWLPINHLLYLLLVWNNWAWHTGFAGSFVSMLAYVASAAGVYLTVKRLTGQTLAAWAGAAAFALNLNMLYLQTTPLTETFYLALLTWSIYCFVTFVQTDDPRYLIGLGALGFLQVLSRYDGWFVVCVQSGLLMVQQLRAGRPWRGAFGRVVVASAPAAFGVALWLLWNMSFGNPFYFAVGAGSAKAQQNVIAASSGLLAKGHLPVAFWLYAHAVMDNIGLQVLVLGLAGAVYFIMSPPGAFQRNWRWGLAVLLAAPIIFNVVSLWQGFSTISLPELGAADGRGQWFNVRYGIIALPALAIAFGLFARWSRGVAVALLAVVVLQAAVTASSGLITVADGTQGASAFTEAGVADALHSDVRPGEHVLMSFGQFNPVSVASGLNLSQFIHEGVQADWQPALDDPTRHVQWIVLAPGNPGDPVYAALNTTHHGDFNQTFRRVYTSSAADIYESDALIAARAHDSQHPSLTAKEAPVLAGENRNE